MTEKRLFWRQFWLLWGAGVILGAIFAALVRIPTTPLATLLLLRNHSQKPLLLAVEAIEVTVGLAISVSCGLFAAHRVGLGAPILEKWLRADKIKPQLRPLLVPALLVGLLIAVISMLPSLSVFHPNRQLARQEAERISESPDGAKLAERLGRFAGDRPLSLTSLTVSYMNAAISQVERLQAVLVRGNGTSNSKSRRPLVYGRPDERAIEYISLLSLLAFRFQGAKCKKGSMKTGERLLI